jgi:hypothetical protein
MLEPPMTFLTLISLLGPAQAVEYAEILPIGTLMEEADQAVQGHVIRTSSEWGDDGLIYTRVVLDAEDRLVASSEPTTSFLVPGGEMGEVRLTVPGAPTFTVGEDVLVFLMDDRLLGLGQGTFRVQGGKVSRRVDLKPERISIKHVFGDPMEARGCRQESMMAAFEDGWSLRGHAMVRLGEEDSRALEVTLMEGIEYAVQVCGDGLGEGVSLSIFDQNDQPVAHTELAGATGDVHFKIPETGPYWLAATNVGLTDGYRSAVSISVRYR